MICVLTRVTDGEFSHTLLFNYYLQTFQHTIVVEREGSMGMHVTHARLTVGDCDIDSVLTNPHSEYV